MAGIIAAGMFIATAAQANNLSVENVSLGSRNPSTKTLVVTFDVSWDNSWRNKINHDAVWLTVRLNNTQDAVTNKKLCTISNSGIDPAGSSVGTAAGLELFVPADKRGAFLRRSSNAAVGSVSTDSVQLTIDYNACGFSDSDQVYASVFGLEMVFIPEGSFYAGDAVSTASLNQGSADNDPWAIISENAIPVSNSASNAYRYVSGGNPAESLTGATFTVPAAFPKGYGSFYVMKYELTEGQWVEFVNSLGSSAARANRDITDALHKNSDSVLFRNTVSCSGTPLTCSSERPSRAVSFLTWMDLAAFLDWSALRPLTELEFEKIARGPVLAVGGEFAWGSTSITAAASISGDEDGTETIADTGANANYDNATFNGGDASSGSEYQQGALRGGIFASASADRSHSGAGYYGVMELSGNLKERVVTIGNAHGLGFDGSNGDGALGTTSSFEGNADQDNWPGLSATAGQGVISAEGSGFRGGSWADAGAYLRISDRAEAALTSADAAGTFGGRGARGL